LHDSLRKVRAVISLVRQHAQDQRDHLRWTVMLIYCEHLLADAPLDLALAKKNLSAAMRAVRQAAQQSAAPVVVLPDRLTQDVLFQIGLFAPVTRASQNVRDGFALDWQLRPGDDLAITERVNEQKHQLLASLDDLELAWPSADPGQRRRRMEAIASSLQAMPALASAGDSLLAVWTDDHSHSLFLAVGLLMVRAAVDTLDNDRASHTRNTALLALESIPAHTNGAGASGDSLWDELGCLAPDLQRPIALAALRAAILATLADAERKADAMVESGDAVAALRELISSANRVIGALSLVGKSSAVQRAVSLKKSLCAAEQHAASTASDMFDAEMQRLILQWVQLHEWVDTWPAEDHADDEHIDSHDIRNACDGVDAPTDADSDSVSEASSNEMSTASLDELPGYQIESSANHSPGSELHGYRPADRLEQIFIQEATQRLSRLNQVVSTWASNPADSLPLEVANEAHGLAGSSATVGRRRLHDGALALEQVVDHLVNLPLESQHGYADALLQGVRALEQEFHSTQLVASTDPADPHTPDNADALSALLKLPADLSDSPLVALNHPPAESDQGDPSDQIDQCLPSGLSSEAAQPAPHSIDAYRTEHARDPLILDGRDECGAALDSRPDALSANAELFAVFSEEAAELMPLLAQQMETWLAAPRDDTQRSGVLRLLHTLKGSARMAGEMMLGERLHRMEHEVSQFARADSFQDHQPHSFRHELAELLAEAGLLSAGAAESDSPAAPRPESWSEPREAERAGTERSQGSQRSSRARDRQRRRVAGGCRARQRGAAASSPDSDRAGRKPSAAAQPAARARVAIGVAYHGACTTQCLCLRPTGVRSLYPLAGTDPHDGRELGRSDQLATYAGTAIRFDGGHAVAADPVCALAAVGSQASRHAGVFQYRAPLASSGAASGGRDWP
jgi:HPt (histidine-containing phosphotransfer) domain-containing protein